MNNMFKFYMDSLPTKVKTSTHINARIRDEDFKAEDLDEAKEVTMKMVEEIGKIDMVEMVREPFRILKSFTLEYPNYPKMKELDLKIFEFMKYIETFFKEFNEFYEPKPMVNSNDITEDTE